MCVLLMTLQFCLLTSSPVHQMFPCLQADVAAAVVLLDVIQQVRRLDRRQLPGLGAAAGDNSPRCAFKVEPAASEALCQTCGR